MRARKIFLLVLLTAQGACSTPDAGAEFVPQLPDEATFPYVAELMVRSCGTLDCHGSVYRNLQVYGDEGLRLASTDRPCVPAETTASEVDTDYKSLVGLEPESLSQVMADHGANPERLTLLAKPLGLETHKGGTVFAMGSDSYNCFASWLAGHTDVAACTAPLGDKVCGLPPLATVDAGTD